MTVRTVPEREDPNHEKTTFLGIDMSTPCLKTSLMNSIGSGMLVGVAYNLVRGKSPALLSCEALSSFGLDLGLSTWPSKSPQDF